MSRAMTRKALAEYTEEWGLLFEQSGLPKMAGRIWGWLLVSDPAYQTALQLGDVLGASKASISTNTRLLERAGLIERVGVPGARQSYFQVRADAYTTVFQQKMQATALWRAQAERGLSILKGSGQAHVARLRQLREFYAFMESEQQKLLERWNKKR